MQSEPAAGLMKRVMTMNNRPLNAGIIGAGAFMGRQHLPNLADNPRYRVHTICDLNRELLEQRRREFNPVRVTVDDREVLDDPEIDVLFIGTRNALHAHYIEQAAQRGKPVFVEKPMTSNYAETERILAAVRANPVQLGVGFNRRYAPIMLAAKQSFEKYRKGSAHLIYRIVDDHDIRPRYIFDMQDGGGHLLQEACHIFDLLAWFLDAEPVEVYAAGPLETDNIVVLTFDDGSLATVVCGGKGGLYYPKELMEVFCNRTTLAVDGFFELRIDGIHGNLIRAFPESIASGPGASSMDEFYRTSFAMRPDCAPDDTETLLAGCKRTADKGHRGIIDAFARSILSGEPFRPGAIDGARATDCALKCYESIREQRPVTLACYGGADSRGA